jgi:hypothetical protein
MKNIILFIVIALSIQLLSSQNADYTNCSYEYVDLNISINGWNASRLDYTDANYRNTAVGLPSRINFTDAESQVTAEFGYPWFTYQFGENTISFAGVIFDVSLGYTGQNQLNSLVLKDSTFNINGIRVGDSVSTINSQFNNICHNSADNVYVLLYGPMHSLSFYYNSQTNVIVKIVYDTLM